MKPYAPRLPRAAFGVAAAAMTALTFGLLVVVPAHVSSGAANADVLATQRADSPTPIEVAIDPARIEVVGQRDQRKAFGLVRHDLEKQDHTKAQTI